MANEHQARFTSLYTREQKDAILRCVLLRGKTVREAQRLARAGKLGLPAFGSDADFGYAIVRLGRGEFEATNDEALERTTRDTLRNLHLANLKAARALGPKTDPGERARVAKALAETAKTLSLKPAAVKGKAKPVNGQTSEALEHEAPSDDTLSSLLGLAGRAEGPHDGGPSNGAVEATG